MRLIARAPRIDYHRRPPTHTHRLGEFYADEHATPPTVCRLMCVPGSSVSVHIPTSATGKKRNNKWMIVFKVAGFGTACPLTWRPIANGTTLYSLTAVLHVMPSGRMLSLRHVRSESGEWVFVGHLMGMRSAPKGVRRVRCKATALEIRTVACVLRAP